MKANKVILLDFILMFIITYLLLTTLVCIIFFGIAISNINRFQSCLASAIGR